MESDNRRWTLRRSYTTGGTVAFPGPSIFKDDEVEVVPVSEVARAYAEGWADCEAEPHDE
jgi:hypothetical protein